VQTGMREMHDMSEMQHSGGAPRGLHSWILHHGQEIYIAKCIFEGFIYAVALLYLMTHW